MIVIYLVLSLALVLFLVNKKINMGLSLMIGAVILLLLSGYDILSVISVFKNGIFNTTTIELAATIGLISILGKVMETYKVMEHLIISMNGFLNNEKISIMIAPIIMGVMLVTGGALLSCPVVNTLGDNLKLSNEKKAGVNLIYRHALYFMLPLAPAFILAVKLGDFYVWDFVKIMLPIPATMYILGYFVYLKSVPSYKREGHALKVRIKYLINFIKYGSPIITALALTSFGIKFYLSTFFGVILTIIIHHFEKDRIDYDNKNKSYIKTAVSGINISMIIAILGIMIFKEAINQLDELYVFLDKLISSGVPVELIIIIATGIISFPLAIMQSGVAILFPLILPLAKSYDLRLVYAMFIYTSSFMFYFISPLHMCQVLTLEYFNVSVNKIYRDYLKILPVTFVVMIVVYILVKNFV